MNSVKFVQAAFHESYSASGTTIYLRPSPFIFVLILFCENTLLRVFPKFITLNALQFEKIAPENLVTEFGIFIS